jgi:hypothetical protein
MSDDFVTLATSKPDSLDELARNPNLSSKARKAIEQFKQEMALIAYRTKEGQDKLSLIYLYTMWKADQTLTGIETMKILRSPIAPAPELDVLEKTLRQRYLEQMDQLAHSGSVKVVEKVK